MAPPTPAELDAIERNLIEFARAAGAEIVDEPDLGAWLIRHSDPAPTFNRVARVRWRPEDVTRSLAAVEQRMRADERWPSIVVSEGLTEPANLAELLETTDWKRIAAERIMFTRHAPVVPHLDPGLRVEAVTTKTAAEFVALESENFGLPPKSIDYRVDALRQAIAAGIIRGFLLRLVGEPVATLRLISLDRVAGLGGIGVAARHRRRGYGRMITAIATRAGLATGHSLVWLSVIESNTVAVELYRSLGYEPTFTWSRWAAPAR